MRAVAMGPGPAATASCMRAWHCQGAMLFASDQPPGMPYEGMKGVMIALQFDTVDEARHVFDALALGGKVTMPLAPAFWTKIFGMVNDRFGVSWAVNGEPIAFK